MKSVTFGGISYLPEAKAIIAMKNSADRFLEPDTTLKIDNYEIIPWGDDNIQPQTVMEKIAKSEVILANLEFNVLVGYGQGIKPMLRVIENGKVTGYDEIFDDEKVLRFCDENDIARFFIEQMMDFRTFYNVFPEIIINKGKNEIVQIRSKEAAFSRWGKMDPRLNRIMKHYYSSKWDNNPTKADIDVTDVLDSYSPLADLRDRLKTGKFSNLRFVIPINFPTPGKTYYQTAPWWSLFSSGWYDFSIMVPAAKKALMKNRFSVKYVIYLSPKYFKQIFKDEGIDPNDEEATKARIDQEHQYFSDFLTGSENAGRGIVALKDMVQSTAGAKEEKYIEIETINTSHEGGEFIDDSEEVSNIISYVMGVHSSLIGSTPGKNKGSFSGTDKRELFMMKQALMKPFRDRLLRPLELVSRFNNWDRNIVWAVPDIEFPTLDKAKTGQQTTITE